MVMQSFQSLKGINMRMSLDDIQIMDDQALLELMLSDMKQCEDCFKPTHFWQYYEKRSLSELKTKGLKDFRRSRNNALRSFGAVDLFYQPYWTKWEMLRNWKIVQKLINWLFPNNPSLHINSLLRNIVAEHHYWRVKDKYNQIKMDIRNCPTSYFGNPEGIVQIEGKPWTATHLEYCSLFADAARYISFRPNGVFCELGTGMARNIEMLASLFEGATFIVFDIPPQLYVANQYLVKVFGSRVVEYEDANLIDPTNDDHSNIIKGKIVIQPTWRMPLWASTKIDIFWNSASFQEMEPEIVSNYLILVKKMCPEYIYINAMPAGNYHPGEALKGGLGTIKPVLENYYFEYLRDSYVLNTTYNTDHLDSLTDHRSYIFKRKEQIV